MNQSRVLGVMVAAGGLLLGGCNNPGGTGWSMDRFVYQSHEWQPWTVSLIDARTGENLWSVDVPVGKQLVMGFRQGSGPNQFKPDIMYWGITEFGRGVSRTSNQMPVPAAHSRRIEPVLRPTPELPGTPLPGSPFAETTPAEKTVAAKAGKMPPGVADTFAPASPRPAPPIKEAKPAPEQAQPQQPQPSPEPQPAPQPSSPSDDPPIDLPQGTRGPR